MANTKSRSNSPPDRHASSKWFDVEDLIAGLDAPIPLKYLLERIRRRTNPRKRYAWASQRKLAWDLGVELRTVERLFAQAKTLGVVGVRRVRTGKGKTDQFNQYWLNDDRLKQLQRRPQPSETESEQPTPASGAKNEHPTNHAGAPDTHVGGSTKYFKTADDAAPVGVAVDVSPVKISEVEHAHRRRPPCATNPTTDDARVSDLLPEAYSPKPKVNGQRAAIKKQRQKTLPRALAAWARVQILKRANDHVRNRHAYVRASMPGFLENLSVEVEEFLTGVAQNFCMGRNRTNPGAPVAWNDVFAALAEEAGKHQLQVVVAKDPEMYRRATRTACELLGWEMTE